MSGDREHNEQRRATGPIQRVEWVLISAMPYPVTGETVNIGIVYSDSRGRKRLVKGPYRKRLAAFVPEPTIRRAIETEILQLERKLDRSGELEESRHIVKSQKSALVRRENRGWMNQILEQMVPAYSGSGA